MGLSFEEWCQLLKETLDKNTLGINFTLEQIPLYDRPRMYNIISIFSEYNGVRLVYDIAQVNLPKDTLIKKFECIKDIFVSKYMSEERRLMSKLTFSEISNIQKYNNLDEGFEDIAPRFFNAEVDPIISFHLNQLRFHRERIEKLLGKEYDRLVEVSFE